MTDERRKIIGLALEVFLSTRDRYYLENNDSIPEAKLEEAFDWAWVNLNSLCNLYVGHIFKRENIIIKKYDAPSTDELCAELDRLKDAYDTGTILCPRKFLQDPELV